MFTQVQLDGMKPFVEGKDDLCAKSVLALIASHEEALQRLEVLLQKLEFLKSKGLTVAPVKEAGKDPYLAYVIEPGSELCDLETLRKLTDAEVKAGRLLEACQAALDFIETGKNPAAGCVAAPIASVAIAEMLRGVLKIEAALIDES